MFPRQAGWCRRISVASSADATRSRSSTSPRAQWRPTRWKDDDVAEFLELMKGGPIKSASIHAVYLINPATKDREMRKKSADSLIHALRMGDEIKADGVVVHPGSTVGEPQEEALPRVGEMVRHALAESDRCRLLLENTAGAGNTARALVRGAARARRPCGRRQAHRHLPRLLPHVRERIRHHDRRQAHGRAGPRAEDGRQVAPAQPPHERLADEARLEPRPPRAARRRRDRRARLCRFPVRAPLREAARPLRGPRQGRQGRREGRHRPDAGAAPQRAEVA